MTGHHWPSKGAPGQRGDHGCSKPEERLGGVWPGPEERGVRARPASAQAPEGSREQMEPQCSQQLCSSLSTL